MTISLVSAPVIGFDLVRHPAGAAIAGTLVWALSLGPRDLPLFADGPADPTASGRSWQRLLQVRDALGPGALHGSQLAPVEQPGASSLQAMIVSLRRSLIADLDDLEHLIRGDVLAWATESASTRSAPTEQTSWPETVELAAGSVLAAVAADWVDGVERAVRDELAAPARRVREQTADREPDVGPNAQQLHRMLEVLRRLDPGGRRRLREVNALLGPGGSAWAQAMHEASWAALTTGRIRAAATAQLLAVQAFVTGGLDAADGAEGVWNLVSGQVHALVVADVLAEPLQAQLGRGWRAAVQSG